MTRLLLVEDSIRLQALLSESLRGADYPLDVVGTVAEARAATAEVSYALQIIDLRNTLLVRHRALQVVNTHFEGQSLLPRDSGRDLGIHQRDRHLPKHRVLVIRRNKHVVEVELLERIVEDASDILEVDPLMLIKEVITTVHLE